MPKHVIILSEKGGVGKSTCCAEIGRAFSRTGAKVGLLDLDWHDPNLPFLFNLEDAELSRGKEDTLVPPMSREGIHVFSAHYLWSPEETVLLNEEQVIADIKQVLQPGIIDWREPLDYIILDTPPATKVILLEAFSSSNLLGAIAVCQPSRVSRADAERTIGLLREKEVPILGIICNQAFLEGSEIPLFDLRVADIQALAEKYDLPKVWTVPHSTNLAPHFDAIVKSLPSIQPVTLKRVEYNDEPLRQIDKLGKILRALGGKND